jgi:hypothetical protein
MLSKLALVLAVSVALFQAPVAAFTGRCCSYPGSQEASFSDGSCAAMACCVVSDGTAKKPMTPAPVANELSTFPAPVCLVSLIDLPANPQLVRFAKTPTVAHSPPTPALLCTFLI